MKQVHSILVIHQGAIGDFILSLPAISSFRNSYPDAFIEIRGYPHILRLVEKRFYADKISSVDQKGMAPFYNEDGSLDTTLVECFKQFDLIVIFGREGSKTLLSNLQKVHVKEVCFVDAFPQDNDDLHVIDYQLSQLSRLGYPTPDNTPTLFPDEEDGKRAREFFHQRGLHDHALTIAVHIGSGSRMKTWPAERFVQLSEKLIQADGANIILPIGPADEKMAEEYMDRIDSEAIIPVVNLPLNELAAILKKCNGYVGNDSGITHVAAAVGISVVALFGPTDPRIWGVRGDRVTIISKGDFDCSPCSREEMKRCMNRRCLETISVEDVYGAVASKLEIKEFRD